MRNCRIFEETTQNFPLRLAAKIRDLQRRIHSTGEELIIGGWLLCSTVIQLSRLATLCLTQIIGDDPNKMPLVEGRAIKL
jgi:hypothetical protein